MISEHAQYHLLHKLSLVNDEVKVSKTQRTSAKLDNIELEPSSEY